MLLLADTPGSQQHTYTYLFCDLRTDVLLAELPLSDVSYSTELNGIGVMRGHIPYADDTLPLDPEAASTPGRTAVYVDRDGVIVWGGILWTRQPNGAGKDIAAAEFLSYYQHRYIKTTLSTDPGVIADDDFVPDGQRLFADQMYIVWSLMRYAHAQPGGDIGVDINALAGPATGIVRQVTYPGYERPEIYKAIADMAAAADGIDLGIEVGWTTSANNQAPTRYRRARAWFPRRGRTAADSGLVFAHGGAAGSILDYTWPEDGTALATEVSGLGEGDGDATLQTTAQDTDKITSGWPLLEAVTKYDGVTDTARLQSLTDADLTARSQSQVQPSFTVQADADPPFGSYSVGDEALFVIDPSTRTPAGREAVLRIVAIENTAVNGPERVGLKCVAV